MNKQEMLWEIEELKKRNKALDKSINSLITEGKLIKKQYEELKETKIVERYYCPRCGAKVYSLDSLVRGRCEECAKQECIKDQILQDIKEPPK